MELHNSTSGNARLVNVIMRQTLNGDPRIHGVSLFDYEPMTLEAGFGAAAAIMEMLLQSQNGIIRVFSSVPDQWHDAYFQDLRAEGAFVVTAKMAAGKVVYVRIESEAGRPCRVKNSFGGVAMTVENSAKGTQQEFAGELASFDTEAGAIYLVYPSGAKPAAKALGPESGDREIDQQNYYGVKRLARF